MMDQHKDKSEHIEVAHVALRDTECMVNPANTFDQHKGLIRKGDVVWFHPDHCGSGPVWLQARLRNKSLRYVHLCDFRKV